MQSPQLKALAWNVPFEPFFAELKFQNVLSVGTIMPHTPIEYTPDELEKLKLQLSQKSAMEDGLSEAELLSIEQRYGFRFPPELRAFLAYCLPISGGFLDWRRDHARIIDRLNGPMEGIEFDIRMDDWWFEQWGPRPGSLDEAISIATQRVAQAPKLVPICTHCYLPEDPYGAGSPVFSVYQTDIIYTGKSLAVFIEWYSYEGDKWDIGHMVPEYSAEYKHIPFWSDVVLWGATPVPWESIKDKVRARLKIPSPSNETPPEPNSPI